MQFLDFKFQILIVVSQEHDISNSLFIILKQLIVFSCPSKVNTLFKVFKSQTIIELSLEPEAIKELSEFKEAILQIVHSCPSNLSVICWEYIFHILIKLSSPPVRTNPGSGNICKQLILLSVGILIIHFFVSRISHILNILYKSQNPA